MQQGLIRLASIVALLCERIETSIDNQQIRRSPLAAVPKHSSIDHCQELKCKKSLCQSIVALDHCQKLKCKKSLLLLSVDNGQLGKAGVPEIETSDAGALPAAVCR